MVEIWIAHKLRLLRHVKNVGFDSKNQPHLLLLLHLIVRGDWKIKSRKKLAAFWETLRIDSNGDERVWLEARGTHEIRP